MVSASVQCWGPLSDWSGLLTIWMGENGVQSERSVRTARVFARFSSWMMAQGLGRSDLSEDLVDEYVRAEQQRSGSMTPAAFQYLPLVKRFFADQQLMVLRSRASRDRHGIPRLRVGPLAGLIGDLVAWLGREGYVRGTTLSVAETAARLSAWMATEGTALGYLDDDLLARFVAAQTSGPVRHPSSARRIAAVRRFLLATGVLTDAAAVTASGDVVADSAVSECLRQWGEHLLGDRGMRAGTVREYQRWAQPLLDRMEAADGSIRWQWIDACSVNQYVTEQGRGYSLASRRHLVTAVRSLLDWAWTSGRVDRPMKAMVLRPARDAADLPRALSSQQVEAIKAAADTTTTIGRRDFAVVVILARLGLRAGEAAALRLDDIDWRHGQLTVHGKNGRVLTLPLPADVAEALVAYLRSGRPASAADRSIFVRVRPPLVGLSSKGISGIVAALAKRAGLGTVHAHRLRHTAATGVLAHGGSLAEARELLGHARAATTMIYARTDVAALSVLAVPWGHVPGAPA